MMKKTLSVMVVLMMCVPALMAADVYASPDASPAYGSAPAEPDYVPEDGYVKGQLLVKDPEFSLERMNVPCASAERLYEGSPWHRVVLEDGVDTMNALQAVRASGEFQDADLNYLYRADSAGTVDVSGNPDVGLSTYLESMGIKDAWQALVDRGVEAGGSRDVVIAVLDTGVDYKHEDLKANIWSNPGEIPGNGIDDDGNGYVDDIVGWDFVSDDNSPMDDNGHGTHVAGISAAANNDKGTVGVAFNCQIMCLKAGNAKGEFGDVEVARAVNYAYNNGADVINMSIGGPGKSPMQYDAMKDAQDRCIIVAAAGNSTQCNNMQHMGTHQTGVSYPGAYPFTIGVMSTLKDGTEVSWFSNYDDTPYDNVEYDVYSAGSEIFSTYPHGKYATLNGTSMATPVMSGLVALLLSLNQDRDVLTLDMVRSAVVNAGSVHPFNPVLGEADTDHAFCNAMDAIRILENGGEPFVNPMTPKYMDRETGKPLDSVFVSVDAGASLRIGADVFNRGTDAGTVIMTFSTDDPYLTYREAIWGYGDMPIYSGRECVLTGEDSWGYFDVDVSPDCPNGHAATFALNVEFTDPDTGETVQTQRDCSFDVKRTMTLPGTITEDTVYDDGYAYVINGGLTVPEGVSVIFGEGCKVSLKGETAISVEGSLQFLGTADDRVTVNSLSTRPCSFERVSADSVLRFEDCDITDITLNNNGLAFDDRTGFYGCSLDLTSASLFDTDLINFTDSQYVGSVVTVGVYGAAGSVMTFKGGLDALFGGDMISDCQMLMDFGEFSSNYLSFKADMDNVLIIGYPGCDADDTEFVVDEGIEVSRLCFGAPFQDQTVLPSVPVSELDLGRLRPMVMGYGFADADGKDVEVLQNEKYTMTLTFSVPMDTDVPIRASAFQVDTNNEFPIKGDFVSDTEWSGELDLSRVTVNHSIAVYAEGSSDASGNGPIIPTRGYPRMEMKVHEEPVMTVEPREYGPGAEITFLFPDYLKCQGYNLYRTDAAEGVPVPVNEYMILEGVVGLEDLEALPGHTYTYSLTWFDMNLKESPLYGAEVFTVPDVDYRVHGSVIAGTDLKVWFDVTGDIDETEAGIRYWTSEGWKSADAECRDGSYLAVIPGEDITGDGLEFYITATDGVHTVTAGDGHHPLSLDVHVQNGTAVISAAVILALLSAVLIAVLRRH